jgi:hypothetical protein
MFIGRRIAPVVVENQPAVEDRAEGIAAHLDGDRRLGYTTAKTLASALTEAVSTLEKATGNTIMNSQEVETGLRKFMGEQK